MRMTTRYISIVSLCHHGKKCKDQNKLDYTGSQNLLQKLEIKKKNQ